MPAQPAWFHRLDEILADLRAIGLLRSLRPCRKPSVNDAPRASLSQGVEHQVAKASPNFMDPKGCYRSVQRSRKAVGVKIGMS